MTVEANALVDITTTVNGKRIALRVPARQHLVDFLREALGLAGTHLGCEHGVCSRLLRVSSRCRSRRSACYARSGKCEASLHLVPLDQSFVRIHREG